MSGFNMPPGVSPSDIPGNRPEDTAHDAMWDRVCSVIDDVEALEIKDPCDFYEKLVDKLVELCLEVREEGSRGHSSGSV